MGTYRRPVTSDVDGRGLLDQRERRLRKLGAATTNAGDALPYRYPTNHTATLVRERHPDLAPDTRTTDRVRVAGRLDLVRRHGGLTFAALRDRTGTLQLFVDSAVLGAAAHHAFDDLDRGDWVGVE